MLWQHHLKNSKLAAKAVLVAVDLPGYGGSDNLPNYGPDQVLNVLSVFILRMREQYIQPDPDGNGRRRGRVLIVAHDWGALLAFRLAAEAPQLADRFILSNAVHPPLAFANINTRLQAASHMLSSWKHAPNNLRLLSKAFANIKPVLKQIIKSGYIFVFRLPTPLSSTVGAIGDYWMLRLLNAATVSPDPKHPLDGSHGAETLASSIGPGPNQCAIRPQAQNTAPTSSSSDKSTACDSPLCYSDAVRRRAPSGGWSEKLRLYRDGCLTCPWNKSLDMLWCLNQLENSDDPLIRRRSSGSTAGLFDVGPKGVLGAPTTVIWGREDVAIENCIAIEGLGDYFGVRGSQLVVIGRCGHWTPVERLGAPVFEMVIEWTLAGEQVSLKRWFGDDYPLVTISIEK
jgi:pimeloyl-ACP methyl ester carboxylesterase